MVGIVTAALIIVIAGVVVVVAVGFAILERFV